MKLGLTVRMSASYQLLMCTSYRQLMTYFTKVDRKGNYVEKLTSFSRIQCHHLSMSLNIFSHMSDDLFGNFSLQLCTIE